MTTTTRASRDHIDLPEVRRNLVRLAGVQAALLLGILLAWRFLPGLGLTLALWVALLPVLVTVWSASYYRDLKRAADAGGGKDRYATVNRVALKRLAGAGLVWFAGLVAVAVYSLI